jgi:hypothetical protein
MIDAMTAVEENVDSITEVLAENLTEVGMFSGSSEELAVMLATDQTEEMIEGYMLDAGTAEALHQADMQEALFSY